MKFSEGEKKRKAQKPKKDHVNGEKNPTAVKIVGVLLRAALAEKQRNMMKHNSKRQAGQRGLIEVVGKKKCCYERRLGRTSVKPLSDFTNTHACEKRTISNLCVGVQQQQSRASPQKSDRNSSFALTTMMASSLRKQKKKEARTTTLVFPCVTCKTAASRRLLRQQQQ